MHLDKNADLRPIGVWEKLHRIAGKVVMSILKDDAQGKWNFTTMW